MNPAPHVQPSPRVPKAILVQLYSTLAGVPAVWQTEPNPDLGEGPGLEQAFCKLTLSSFRNVGIDELRTVYDADADQNVNVLLGNRQFTLTMQARSLDETLEAYDLCERVRFRLRTAVAQAIYRPAFLSLRDIQAVHPVYGRTSNTQVLLSASMDVRWNWLAWADPLDPQEGGYIQTVDGFGDPPKGNRGIIIPVTLKT